MTGKQKKHLKKLFSTGIVLLVAGMIFLSLATFYSGTYKQIVMQYQEEHCNKLGSSCPLPDYPTGEFHKEIGLTLAPIGAGIMILSKLQGQIRK